MARVVAFGATIYLARTLGASGFGIIGTATAILLYCQFIADAGVDVLGARDVAHRPEDLGALVPAIVAGRLLVAGLTALVLIGVGHLLWDDPDATVLTVYALTLFPLALNTRWVFLGLERGAPAAVSRIAGEAVMVALVLLLVHDLGDVARVPLAQLTGDLLAALFLAVRLRQQGLLVRPAWRPAVFGPFLARSWHLTAHALLGLLIYNSDLLFLRALHTSAEVGYYAAAYTLVSFLLNLGVAYSQSLLPTMTRVAGTPGQLPLYHTAMAQLCALGIPLAVGGYLVAGDLVRLVFGPGYEPAGLALGILLLSIPVAYLRSAPQVALIVAGKQALLARFTAVVAGVNLALNALLIPRWGILGAASATVLTEVLRTGAALWFVRGDGLPVLPAQRLVPIVLGTAGMGLAVTMVSSQGVVLAVVMGGVAYGVCLMMLRVIRWSPGRGPEIRI